ncbi:WD repeat-containing protein 53 isoform X2 [Impatiens glandulifera]|uniref:WD repeat-containing protein 53 isoform X2 n=1 Tax=Impatiens glandulifera TaxID=253017 RepID=UPI001FB11900|nr:WD repeat-containing protein 53 isoform X2 [Impatiens glandulifera]
MLYRFKQTPGNHRHFRREFLQLNIQDGRVCLFDLRCKDVLFVMNVSDEPVSSLCFNSGNEDIMYVSAGTEVKAFDLRSNAASWDCLTNFNYNKEEINQLVCDPKSRFLAAADDKGEVKVVDISQQCLYKSLRAGHTNICSSVQFLPWTSWEVVTGGLDSKLIMWDFSKGRPYHTIDLGVPDANNRGAGGQGLNPAFIHSITVPEPDMVDSVGKLFAVGRGDGIINVIDVESELLAASKTKPKKKITKSTKNSSNPSSNDDDNGESDKKGMIYLDYTLGGHTAAASCVAFSMFGEKGKYIISGGNDKSVKVWDWSRGYHSDGGQTSRNNDALLSMNINLTRKVNWLCTTASDSENLIVCDTSKLVKVFSIA